VRPSGKDSPRALASRGATGAHESSIGGPRRVGKGDVMMIDSFCYDEANIAELERGLSQQRLSTYRRLAGGDRAGALRLHAWNTAVGAALFGPIQVLEIVLRNAVDARLSRSFGEDWYFDCWLTERERAMLKQVLKRLVGLGKPATCADIVANLSFGFWLSLLAGWHENDLWRTQLCQVFPHAPQPLRRQQVYGPLHNIRVLRNRIAHHKLVVRRADLSANPQRDHGLIIQVTSWISPVAASWIQYHSRFEQVWNNRPM
jgi:hypothetical protein